MCFEAQKWPINKTNQQIKIHAHITPLQQACRKGVCANTWMFLNLFSAIRSRARLIHTNTDMIIDKNGHIHQEASHSKTFRICVSIPGTGFMIIVSWFLFWLFSTWIYWTWQRVWSTEYNYLSLSLLTFTIDVSIQK